MYTTGHFFGKIHNVIRTEECFMDRLIKGFAFVISNTGIINNHYFDKQR